MLHTKNTEVKLVDIKLIISEFTEASNLNFRYQLPLDSMQSWIYFNRSVCN